MNLLLPHMRLTAFSSFSVLLAILPAISFANDTFDGFYFGLAAGGTETQADIDANHNATFVNSSDPSHFFYIRDLNIDNSPDSYHESGIGELRLGYGKTFDSTPLYLGLEIFGNIADRKMDSTTETSLIQPGYYLRESTVNTNMDVKLNDAEYGFDFRPGILLSPTTLFYARIGAAANELTINVQNYLSNAFADVPMPPPVNSQNQSTENDNKLGLRLGLGLESAITSALTITADYIYTDYGSVTANGSFDINNSDGTIEEDGFVPHTTADIQSHAVMLGLNYYLQADNDEIKDIDPSMLSVFNGFYSGIKGGLVATNSKFETFTSSTYDPQFSFDPVLVTDAFGESSHLWDNAAIGEVFAGYGHLIGDSLFYAALEIFGNLGERKLEEENTQTYQDSNFDGDPSIPNPFTTVTLSTNTQVKLNPLEWGGDAKLGRFLSETTLLYARVGFAVNEITTSSDNLFSLFTYFSDGTTKVSNLDIEESKDVVGLRLGLGLEQMIWDNLAVTADYVYTDYGDQTTFGTADVLGAIDDINPDGFVNETEVDVHTHVVMLGLAYHW